MTKESYIIPLKKAYLKPRTRRTNYTIKEIYKFLFKHTRKTKENIIISKELNDYIWKDGIQNPPRKVSVNIKLDKDKVYVFLKDSKEYVDFVAKKNAAKAKTKVKAKTQKSTGKDIDKEVKDKNLDKVDETSKASDKEVKDKNLDKVDETSKASDKEVKDKNLDKVDETSKASDKEVKEKGIKKE